MLVQSALNLIRFLNCIALSHFNNNDVLSRSTLWLSHNNNNCYMAICPGPPGWAGSEETFTHPPFWSLSNFHQLVLSTTIHSILPVEITCLAIFLHNLSPHPLWSTSWFEALHLIFHIFLHPGSVFFSQHRRIDQIFALESKITLFIVQCISLVDCWVQELERFANEQDQETDRTALLKDVDSYRKQLTR